MVASFWATPLFPCLFAVILQGEVSKVGEKLSSKGSSNRLGAHPQQRTFVVPQQILADPKVRLPVRPARPRTEHDALKRGEAGKNALWTVRELVIGDHDRLAAIHDAQELEQIRFAPNAAVARGTWVSAPREILSQGSRGLGKSARPKISWCGHPKHPPRPPATADRRNSPFNAALWRINAAFRAIPQMNSVTSVFWRNAGTKKRRQTKHDGGAFSAERRRHTTTLHKAQSVREFAGMTDGTFHQLIRTFNSVSLLKHSSFASLKIQKQFFPE
eukprot:scaffold7339_cov249-Pinguiococcus_pyrenoidosus.AAC.12